METESRRSDRISGKLNARISGVLRGIRQNALFSRQLIISYDVREKLYDLIVAIITKRRTINNIL